VVLWEHGPAYALTRLGREAQPDLSRPSGAYMVSWRNPGSLNVAGDLPYGD
jgi:hypothetical protein